MTIQGPFFMLASLVSWAAISLLFHSMSPTMELFDYMPSTGRILLRRLFFFCSGIALLQISWGIFYLVA